MRILCAQKKTPRTRLHVHGINFSNKSGKRYQKGKEGIVHGKPDKFNYSAFVVFKVTSVLYHTHSFLRWFSRAVQPFSNGWQIKWKLHFGIGSGFIWFSFGNDETIIYLHWSIPSLLFSFFSRHSHSRMRNDEYGAAYKPVVGWFCFSFYIQPQRLFSSWG